MAEIHDVVHKILIVDDEKLIRLTFSAKLKNAGYVPVAVGSVEEAVNVIKESRSDLRAVITDIMMDGMDGFVFRDIIRGYDPTIPIFFMTALDPEEGSGFLKKILEDPVSYYLPKFVNQTVLINRIKNVVASRRIALFIERQMEEQKLSISLAATVQHSMLSPRTASDENHFYTTLWKPKEMVSGDIYEVFPLGDGQTMYILGDIQGHGTSAGIAMTAIQAYFKLFSSHGVQGMRFHSPHETANNLHRFFRKHLANITYMTALVAVHFYKEGVVKWISCGAPDLGVVDGGENLAVNPEGKGALPIGLFEDTVYTLDDVVTTRLSPAAVCYAFTDGMLDMSKDESGMHVTGETLVRKTFAEMISAARSDVCVGGIVSAPQKIMSVLENYGYVHSSDDVSIILFGCVVDCPGVYGRTVPLDPDSIAEEVENLDRWCAQSGWDADLSSRIQLVAEEALMNVHDHGLDAMERPGAVATLRLKRTRDVAELTIWECSLPAPSLQVAAGDSDTAFEIKNRDFSARGRGRLIIRDICRAISRNRYVNLNETTYFVPLARKDENTK